MQETLKGLLTNLIGLYQPNTYQIDGDYEVIADGLAGVDLPWVLSALLFGLSLYCVFRLVGVIINAIRD